MDNKVVRMLIISICAIGVLYWIAFMVGQALEGTAWGGVIKSTALAAVEVAIIELVTLVPLAKVLGFGSNEKGDMVVLSLASMTLCANVVYLLAFFFGEACTVPIEGAMNGVLGLLNGGKSVDPFHVWMVDSDSFLRIPSCVASFVLTLFSGSVLYAEAAQTRRPLLAVALLAIAIPLQYVLLFVVLKHLIAVIVWVFFVFLAAQESDIDREIRERGVTPVAGGPLKIDVNDLLISEPEQAPKEFYDDSFNRYVTHNISGGSGFVKDSDNNFVHVHQDVDGYWYDDDGNLLS